MFMCARTAERVFRAPQETSEGLSLFWETGPASPRGGPQTQGALLKAADARGLSEKNTNAHTHTHMLEG